MASSSHPASPDNRIVYAREFLAGARKRKVQELALAPSALIREDAELRRLLGQVLDVVTDFEETDIVAQDVTTVALSGGVYIACADVSTLAAALADAIECRSPDNCRDWTRGIPCCDDHGADLDQAGAYRALARALRIEVSQ